MIEFKNVSKVYKTKKGVATKALNTINLKIGNKGMVFIVGKSGSGKSTMLNLLGGLDTVTSGSLLINNKNISNFKKKQYDAYRNTYIGFIFQEFNILEQYNVYENIELALQLQNKKTSKEEINQLLKKLGLENIGERKVNELSGGQKQRVAIARALIKNPKIILADEPTGNLDQTSSKQIFDLLKEISKEKLVIVVSHDIEAAHHYADRLIEISDGTIINDSNPVSSIIEENFQLKKSKLPFTYGLKMAVKSLKVKPFKLFMTTILTAMALIFMGFTINCLIFDKETFITNTMRDNHKYVYRISKEKFYNDHENAFLSLTKQDLKKLEQITGSKLNQSYYLYDNGQLMSFEYGGKIEEARPDYYREYPTIFSYVELTDDRLLGKVIGKLPTKANELVIHKYLAEYILKYGVIDSNHQLYQPKTIEELANSHHLLQLGDNQVIISGVVDDNNHQFKEYQGGKSFPNDKFEQYYSATYSNLSSVVYVKGFTDIVKLNSNKELVLDRIHLVEPKEDYYYTGESTSPLKNVKENISIITKDGVKTISSLQKSEVVLSINDLQIYDEKFEKGLSQYLQEHSTVAYRQAVEEYTTEYLKDDKNINKIKLKLSVPNKVKEEYEMAKIVGITVDEYTYVSNQYVEEYVPETKELSSVYVYDSDLNHTKNVFHKLKCLIENKIENGTYYMYQPFGLNDTEIYNVIISYNGLYRYLLIISLVFILFAFLLFSNFISVSISYCKKEIGILRALGARSKDTLKIFTYESLIIALLAWILSVIGWSHICDLVNDSMFGNMYYPINGIMKSPLVPIAMLLFTIIIAFVITFVSISRVNRIKPIDAILNK